MISNCMSRYLFGSTNVSIERKDWSHHAKPRESQMAMFGGESPLVVQFGIIHTCKSFPSLWLLHNVHFAKLAPYAHWKCGILFCPRTQPLMLVFFSQDVPSRPHLVRPPQRFRIELNILECLACNERKTRISDLRKQLVSRLRPTTG